MGMYSRYCKQCGQWPTHKAGCSLDRPPTPAKGQPMPQTREYWEKRAQMDMDLILEQKREIGQLKAIINTLRQKAGLGDISRWK